MANAILPQFRARRCGLVVNVTSSVTLAPMSLAAVYTASKTAITGFTESLAHELAEFNVRVKLVEPGYGPGTRFTANGAKRVRDLLPRWRSSTIRIAESESSLAPAAFHRSRER